MAAATLSVSSNSQFDTFHSGMDSSSPQTDFLKLEDLDNNNTAAEMDFTTTTQDQSATPPPVIVQSKPAKKRKSWGQQLPEPKTTLPPRKRAKTDDEKEQRRIERIKRNRAAAHNSRERKRQEAEVLAVENAQLRTKLEAFEKHFGPLPKHIVLPEVTLRMEDDAETPAPSLIESRGSIATAPSPTSPPDLYEYTNPAVEIKQEPHDSPFSDLQHSFDNLDGKHPMPTLAPLDPTQHSAEMLCDLPCQSSSPRTRVAHSSRTTIPSPSTSITPQTFFTLLTALHLTFLTTYRTLAQATLLSATPLRLSRPAARISASRPASTSPSTISSPPIISRTTVRSPSATVLAQHNATAVLTGFATLREPLVGEGLSRRMSDSAGLAVARGSEAREEDVCDEREMGQDEGVGRQWDRSMR